MEYIKLGVFYTTSICVAMVMYICLNPKTFFQGMRTTIPDYIDYNARCINEPKTTHQANISASLIKMPNNTNNLEKVVQ